MTEIEQKALALVNEVLVEWGVMKNAVEVPKNSDAFARALLRAIEKHEAFKREVSDAVESYFRGVCAPHDILARFILPKPDPLVEALGELADRNVEAEQAAETLREALAKRGLKIVEDV